MVSIHFWEYSMSHLVLVYNTYVLYNPFYHQHVIRPNILGFNKNHINPIFLEAKDYDQICLNSKKSTKLHEPINQGIRPLKLGRRKRLTWYPFLHTFTHWPQKQCLRFLPRAFVIFLQEDKVWKGKKPELPVKNKA